MSTTKQRIKRLTDKLKEIEKEMNEIIQVVATTNETSNSFWNRTQKDVRKIYEKFRVVYSVWSNANIPLEYKKNIAEQIKRIKQMKFKPPKTIDLRKFLREDKNTQAMNAILQDSIATYVIGLDQGEKMVNRLLRATQQINITEKEVNRLIEEGFVEKGSRFGASKALQKELLKKTLDDKYIVVVDKNGNQIFYQPNTYAELVARTKIADAQTAGTVNVAFGFGSNLVQVSSHNTKTPFDAQFEGKIFSLTTGDPDFPKATELPPYHPNCLHRISVVFREVLEQRGTLQESSDFAKGKTDIHPTRKSHIPVSKRFKSKEKAA
jgi:hypothetical protein